MKLSLVLAITAIMNVTAVFNIVTMEDDKRGFDLTNQFRTEEGKSTLSWSDFLYEECHKHSMYQAWMHYVTNYNFFGEIDRAAQRKGFKALVVNVAG